MAVHDPAPGDAGMEERLRAWFDANYEALRAESGHGLDPQVRELAWQEVLLYWKRLGALAARMTESEVHLSLAGCTTPAGRTFTLTGVVDVVEEGGSLTLYDLKTQDAATVRRYRARYARQLSTYVHIWSRLRERTVDRAAVIATAPPPAVRAALTAGGADPEVLAAWDPVVPLPLTPEAVEETLEDFARMVDAVEERRFAPSSPERLGQPWGPRGRSFAREVCRECDGRFSCGAFLAYAGEEETGPGEEEAGDLPDLLPD